MWHSNRNKALTGVDLFVFYVLCVVATVSTVLRERQSALCVEFTSASYIILSIAIFAMEFNQDSI
jgi:hypothetical protein